MAQPPAPLTLGGPPSVLYTQSGRNKDGFNEPRGLVSGGELFGYHPKPGGSADLNNHLFGEMNELPPGFECDAPPEGCYSPSEQYWTIRPRAGYKYDAQRDWLCIGGPGVDGIEFGILRGRHGVFAYYPVGGEYVLKAASATELFRAWVSREISV